MACPVAGRKGSAWGNPTRNAASVEPLWMRWVAPRVTGFQSPLDDARLLLPSSQTPHLKGPDRPVGRGRRAPRGGKWAYQKPAVNAWPTSPAFRPGHPTDMPQDKRTLRPPQRTCRPTIQLTVANRTPVMEREDVKHGIGMLSRGKFQVLGALLGLALAVAKIVL